MRLTQQGFTEEQFRWCFWGPTGGGSAASDAANAGGFGGGGSDDNDDNDRGGDGSDRDAGRSGPSAGDFGGGRGDGADRDAGRSGPSAGDFGGGDDSGFDAGGYVSSAISDFASSAGVPSGPSVSGDRDRDGIPDSIDIDGGSGSSRAMAGVSAPSAPSVSRAPAPSIAPNLVNQPLSVGGAFSMPYDAYQRSPQQMFGYGGLTASPYDPSAISFQGGQAARSYDPLGGEVISQFDMGRSPTVGYQDDRNFLERAISGISSAFTSQPQRAGVYDPRTGTFSQFDGQTTLEKTSDNVLQDAFANFVNPVGFLTGIADTKTYTPLAGGEDLQYSNFSGGLLSDFIGENLVPMSEIEARAAQMGDDDGDDAPLIIPQEVAEIDEETGEPTAFPDFTPREFEYQPFTSQFYTIPSRFTQPYGLLG